MRTAASATPRHHAHLGLVAPILLLAVTVLAGCAGVDQATGGPTTPAPPATAAPTSTSTSTSTSTTAPPLPPPRVAMFGDSTALMTAFGLGTWLLDSGEGMLVDGRLDLGCSIMRGGLRRDHIGSGPNNPICDDWDQTWLAELSEHQPDVAVVQTGPWDILDHQLPGETVWRAPGDPTFDAYLLAEMASVVDALSSQGAHVAWMTLPPQRAGVGAEYGSDAAPATDPARAAAYNALVHQLPALRPGAVTVLPYAEWLAAETGRDAELRPDGIHVSFDTSRRVSDLWLGDQIITSYEQAEAAGPSEQEAP